jgi:predicted type IV restriction endonuclease
VRPEFPTETGKPDYALIWEGKPRIMVEAKPLGADLREARLKGINYTNAKGVRSSSAPMATCGRSMRSSGPSLWRKDA